MTFSKLGTDTQTGQIVELPQAARRQGLYIIGANGTGKTGLIENLILQDIDQGLGVGLLDPHSDLTNAILAKMTKRVDDVILLDIQDEDHPFGLNIFECSNPQSPTAVQKIVDLVMHIFEKLYDVSRQTPRMAQFLRNCTHTLVANPGYTMADIPLLLQDGECRRKLVAQVSDPQVRLFWKTYDALKPSEQFDRAESTINKMDELLQPLPRNIVGQGKTTINIQQVMDERKILLVKLSAQLDQVTSLVGTLLIALFLNAAYSRASIPVNKRKQFNLYADEFQRFATEDFATLLTEARKFGIATTIAHQARYQPGMTDGIRAVSLQAANHVVFRVTSPDADELAGGFDITPQAAWEQEIEKERHERKEEDVIDGTEPVLAPVTDVVGHLLAKGHAHPVVNRFSTQTLPHLKQYQGSYYGDINLFLYQAMMGHDITRFAFTPQIIQYWANALDCGSYTVPMGAWEDTVPRFTQPGPYERQPIYDAQQLHTQARQAVQQLWSSAPSSRQEQQAIQTLDNLHRIMARDALIGEVSVAIEQSFKEQKVVQGSWYCVVPQHIQVGTIQVFTTPYSSRPIDKDWPVLGQESKFYREVDLVQQIERYLQTAPAYYPNFLTARNNFLNFFRELKQVMLILATPDGQIKAPSGLEQPHKRKQINYLTHPRKVIMHPQRTYQDVQKDIANQLAGLPNYTARVKISEDVPQNPGKKCRHCGKQSGSGALYCRGCGKKLPNEYTLTTLKPIGGLGKASLQQRLTTIQDNNKQKGYVRDRITVETEILNRQTGCSGGSPAPQPPQQAQARHARQVPVQGKCPKCGASNTPGARFCNQCGTKL